MAIVHTPTEITTDDTGEDAIVKVINPTTVIVGYIDGTDFKARVVIISGTAINTIGDAVVVNNDHTFNPGYADFAILSDSAVLAVYQDDSSGDIISRVLSISGTTITAESTQSVDTGSNDRVACCPISSSRAVAIYTRSSSLYGRVLGISGTTITVNSEVDIETTDGCQSYIGIAPLSDTSALISYQSTADPDEARFQVLHTITTTFSVGTEDAVYSETGIYLGYTQTLRARNNVGLYTWENPSGDVQIAAAAISGATISGGTPATITSVATAAGSPVVLDSTRGLVFYKESTNSYVDDVSINGNAATLAGNADNFISSGSGWEARLDYLTGNYAVIVYDDATDIFLAVVESELTITNTFYFGLGTLQSQFSFGFKVAPRGMTLDKSLGTVVLGAKDGNDAQIIYADYPYSTGTATASGFPSGVSITALKWI